MAALDGKGDGVRVNARKTDAFDIFKLRHYGGPNLYLATAALVFDFALTNTTKPLPLDDYIAAVQKRFPHVSDDALQSYAHLFAWTIAEVSKLEMDLHLHRWHVQHCNSNCDRLAVESLHARTSRAIAYAVWDWFEAITQNQVFQIDHQIEVLQGLFRRSVYGGPTVYALFKTACKLEIPAFYLWDEGLMQYGYGKHHVRGVATTFDGDSHLDSDFTTRKDDCKAFLATLGFPVPKGSIVYDLDGAITAAQRIGYPVAVKPVVGHKGEGVTANVQNSDELKQSFAEALQAIAAEQPVSVIVEQSIVGKDYRLLCVNGRFVAATERCPAYVVGNGQATIQTLIDQENQTPARLDTPTSALGKIKPDEAMLQYLAAQGLGLNSVIERDRTVYLRQVANLSAGGLSIDATPLIHPDTIILAQDIAQHFRLTCLGIDVIAEDLSRSWQAGNFGILEINAAPGVYMHLKPSLGDSVDVPSHILKTFFQSSRDARIPILTFNQISVQELHELIDYILLNYPDLTIGGICREGVFVNRAKKTQHPEYNVNVQNLLRNPKLDLLVAEYQEDVLVQEGMFYFGSNMVVLNDPTDAEMMLSRDIFDDSTIILKRNNDVSIQRSGLMEKYPLDSNEPFSRVYLKEVTSILGYAAKVVMHHNLALT